MGGRSRTSIFYDAFSVSSGLDYPCSDSSREQQGESSDSSYSSLSPTSGYSSYDILDTDITTTTQERQKRSVSVPRISLLRNSQDYVTGIKPASHRLESHSSNCNIHSAEGTPKHYNTKTSDKSVPKQRRISQTSQKEFFNLRMPVLRRKVLFNHVVLLTLFVFFNSVFIN